MKLVVSIVFSVIFTVSAMAQTAAPPMPVSNGKFAAEFWSDLGDPVSGDIGFQLRSRGIRETRAGNIELWIKIIPNSPAFNKHYSLPQQTAFALQFATVNCDAYSVKLEETTLYNASNDVIKGNPAKLLPIGRRPTGKPRTIGAAVFEAVCIKP